MDANFVPTRIDWALTMLVKAEHSGNDGLVQKAYEDLFVLCLNDHLDLPALLNRAAQRQQKQA